jgi:3-deoxy-manno-octulosonate cytidylyltransferase (CMP-KDO synthetase)
VEGSKKMRIVAVIPARYASSRMPGKPIANILGKPMIWWVYHQAIEGTRFDDVVIATDDKRIYDVCRQYDMNVIMTDAGHNTPTSRLYEVSTKIDGDMFLMLMGDEPLLDRRCFDLILDDDVIKNYKVAALTNTIELAPEVVDFSNQKVVCNSKREALFISRSPIPYPKGYLDYKYEKVTGIQLFSRDVLEFYNKTPRSVIELAEENDLMRFIENDIKVKMINSPYKTISVDTPKDLTEVIKILKGNIN